MSKYKFHHDDPERAERLEAGGYKFHLLDKIAQELDEKLDQALEYKRPIHARWAFDINQYWGVQEETPEAKGFWNEFRGKHVPPQLNITKPKVKNAVGRFCDMLLPNNDRNWKLEPSPVPSLSPADEERIIQEVQQLQLEDDEAQERELDKRIMARASFQCSQMEQEVDDNLQECDYNAECRKIIFDSVQIGTGILGGPFIENRVEERFTFLRDDMGNVVEEDGKPVRTTEAVTKQVAVGRRIDPFMWFPKPARNIEDVEWSNLLRLMNKTQLNKLKEHPGFNEDAIKALILEEPHRNALLNEDLSARKRDLGHQCYNEDEWAVWCYHGPITGEAVKSLKEAGYKIDVKLKETETVFVEIWHCQDIILKAEQFHLEGETMVPFYPFYYEKDESDLFGFSMPYACRDSQRTVAATWEMMVHNARVAAGAQIIYRAGALEPADGSFIVRGPKTWKVTKSNLRSLDDGFKLAQISSNVQDIMMIFEAARAFADIETSQPELTQGDPTMTAPTAQGTAMQMNTSNVVQRWIAKQWDDSITSKFLPRMVKFHMIYNPKEIIKGDFRVKARAASVLLVKDIQVQNTAMLIQQAAQLPEFAQRTNWGVLYERFVSSIDMSADEIVKSDEQMQQEAEQAGEQPDPEMEKIKVLQGELELKNRKLDAEIENRARDDQFREADRQMDFAERMSEVELRREEAIVQRETKMMELAQSREMKLSQLSQDLMKARERLQSQEKTQTMTIAAQAREMALKERMGSGI